MEYDQSRSNESSDLNAASISVVKRQAAASGKVDYSSTRILHDSSRAQVSMVPFYVRRSDGETDLAIKLITHTKAAPPNPWIQNDQKTITLNDSAARELHKALSDVLAVANKGTSGSHIVISVTDGVAEVGGIDPSLIAGAITALLSQKEILRHLEGRELTLELTGALRTMIRLQELKNGVAELRASLDGGVVNEQHYQAWCERNPWALGNAYLIPDSVRSISPSDRLDLLLPNVLGGFRDFVELKRPNMEVLYFDQAHRNYYFSSDLTKAIGQCDRYLNVLHETAGSGLRDYPEVVAYHPRATIVIGRSKDWPKDKIRALHSFNRRFNGITIMTYDQILAQGEQALRSLSPSDDVES